jgi:transposase
MVRKQWKTVTEEARNIVRGLPTIELSIASISRLFDLNRKTVFNIIANRENNTVWQMISTAKENAPRFDEKAINNIVACQNDLTLKEIGDELRERTNISLSRATISRRLKKLNISKKDFR